MYFWIAIAGVLITMFSFFALGMENASDMAGVGFFVGIALMLVGGIMANRAGRKQAE